MEVAQQKVVRKTIYAFLMFLVVRLIEELLIVPHFHLNTKGLLSCVIGIVILLVYIRFDNKALDEIGLIFSAKKIGNGLLFAFALNVVVCAGTYALLYLRLAQQEGSARITFYYDEVERSVSSGMRTFLLWALFALAVALFHAVFYELSFRGLLLTIGMRKLSFSVINALQAALYAVWFLIPILRVLVYQTSALDARGYLKLVAFALVYEFMTALRLGFMRKATGSLWICIFDHIAFTFLLDMIHLQLTSSSMQVSNDMFYYSRMIVYQAISLLICYVYYIQKEKKARQKLQEAVLSEKPTSSAI